VESNRAQMLEERASMTICELFRFHKPPGMHQALTGAVEQFASYAPARVELLPSIKPILEFLQSSNLEDQLSALSALAKITESPECQFKAMKLNVFGTHPHISVCVGGVCETLFSSTFSSCGGGGGGSSGGGCIRHVGASAADTGLGSETTLNLALSEFHTYTHRGLAMKTVSQVVTRLWK
jgi:hypothetical protein